MRIAKGDSVSGEHTVVKLYAERLCSLNLLVVEQLKSTNLHFPL